MDDFHHFLQWLLWLRHDNWSNNAVRCGDNICPIHHVHEVNLPGSKPESGLGLQSPPKESIDLRQSQVLKIEGDRWKVGCVSNLPFTNGNNTVTFDKIDMTLGEGQWPRVTGRTGWNQCALLLEKSVFYMIIARLTTEPFKLCDQVSFYMLLHGTIKAVFYKTASKRALYFSNKNVFHYFHFSP